MASAKSSRALKSFGSFVPHFVKDCDVEQPLAFAAAKNAPLKSAAVPLIHFQQPSETPSLAPIQ